MPDQEMNLDSSSAPLPKSPFSTPLGNGGLRVLQLSDCHLYEQTGGRLAGVNTQGTLEDVLSLIRSSYQKLDLVLATGDLVHDASPEGYTRLCRHLASLGIPVYCLPGNHDVPEVMRSAIARENGGGRVSTPTVKEHGNWVLISLDSTIPGKEGGHLDQEQLQILDDGLSSHPEMYALICLHHHPVPIHSAWMDEMGLDNPQDFFSLLDRHPQVRGVVWGHIHQAFEAERSGVRLLGCPSTCIQFSPRQDRFGLDQVPPGFRWLELQADGTIRTGIQRLSLMPQELDLSVAGY